jgi:DNA-binding PadR family transcriptional regulator
MAAELAGHGYSISPGTLYPTLHRMEEEGLLRSTTEVVEGRARRVYVITPRGRRALRDAKRLLAELAEEVLDR